MPTPTSPPLPARSLRLRHFVLPVWTMFLLLAASWPGAARAQVPGAVDPAFAPVARSSGAITAIATQPDGRLILGGSFYRVGAAVSPLVARLNADGSVDTGFVPPRNLGPIVDLAVGPDGKTVLVEVTGDSYPTPYALLRLNPDGSLDASFARANFPGDPNTDDLRAFTVAVQADGKVLVEGEFYNSPPAIGPSIRRFNVDGTPDTTFQFSKHIETTNLSAILPLPNGQILVGGNSQEYGGQTIITRMIFRLNADGSVDDSYTADTSDLGTVYALALQADGKVVFLAYLPPAQEQGGFETLGGVPRRLNADGTADTSFAPDLDPGASLTSLSIQPDGKVLAGGFTANSDGAIPSGVVRIDADGTVDATFKPVVPLVDGEINALGLLPGGQIIVGGEFDTAVGLARTGLARLNANGTLDTGYVNDLSNVGVAYAVTVQANGLPVVFDSVSFALKTAAVTGKSSAAMRPEAVYTSGLLSSPLASFNADGSVNTIFPFEEPSGTAGEYLVVYPTPYAVTSTQPANSVLARQADGKILVTGYFSDGEPDLNSIQIERFNVDGSPDTSFYYSTGESDDGATYAVLPQPDGKILRAGIDGPYESDAYPLERLNADGSYDATFTAPTDPGATDEDYLGSTFYALALQPDGKIIAAGALNPVAGKPVPDVLRFNANGGVDTGFKSGVLTETAAGQTPYAFALALQADGKVIVGGRFSAVGGVAHNNLARLNADGSLDTGFNAGGPGANGLVRAIAIQADGKIVLGGEFTKVNGIAANGIARLNANGSTDTLFFPGTGTGGTGVVNSLALAPDGSILVGGTFKAFNGQPRDGVVRLAGGTLTVPVITSAATATATAGQLFAYQITANGNPASFGAGGLFGGLTANGQTGLISGTPTAPGTHVLTLRAANAAGTGSQTLTLTVNPAPPVVTGSGETLAAQVGKAFSYQITATGSPTAYGATGLPDGLTLDAGTGVIAGTPTVAGTFPVTLSATNAGGTGTGTLTLVIAALPTVSLAVGGDGDAVEGGQKGVVLVLRTGDTSAPLTVFYKAKGSARQGVDIRPLSGSVVIPAGAVKAKVKIKPIDNATPDGALKVKLRLLAPGDGSYLVGDPAVAKIKVIDSD